MAVNSTIDKPPLIFLMGPTASGKTALAMDLYDTLPVDLISVDSALVYRDMDIGSAKPTAEEQARYPHALIDICDPAEPYSAADFRADALREIAASHRRGRIPLLVGGTMMYFKVLLEGLADMPESDPAVRAALEQRGREFGWPALHKELQAIDPQLAAQLHPNHSQRIARALEVYEISGRTMSQWRAAQRSRSLDQDFRLVQLAIAPRQRATLHQRIAQRFDSMLQQGFEAEVASLQARQDLHKDLPSMRAVGYRQMWEYLHGDYGSGEPARQMLVDKANAATRQLAKRQLTWLRGWQALNWLYTDREGGSLKRSDEILAESLLFLAKMAIK